MSHHYREKIKEIATRYGCDRGCLMNIAKDVVKEFGYISEEMVEAMAMSLNIPLVQVRDMVSFYSFLPKKPLGKYVIRLCNAVVERMKGADEVGKAFEKELGIKFGETTSDGLFTLLHTSCIGLSDQAPGALINFVPLTNLKPSDTKQIIKELKSGKDVSELPQARVQLNLKKEGDVICAPLESGIAVRKALNMKPEEVIAEINKSRLRGRGGAGFPTAMKWDFCRKQKSPIRYLICNADEGEPGTFKDRVIHTEYPDLVFEGMTIAGYAIGAKEGIMYLRGEYAYLLESLEKVLAKRRHLGLLGEHICGREDFNFDIRIQLGAGAYVCGEESALIESLEGKRGAPRDRPPFPVQKGYKNEPTSVNNVETLCCTARILEKGGDWFAKIGTKDSTGTKMLSVSGDCEHPGVYEVEYGITIESLLELVGAKDTQAVQVGGASGKCVAPKDFGRRISFEDLPTGGSIMIFGKNRDLLECMYQFIEFFVEESCGWCVPCRAGTTLLEKKLRQILDGKGTAQSLADLRRIAQTVKAMSRCGLGQTSANPILTTIYDFADLYAEKIKEEDGKLLTFDLQKAMKVGIEASGRTMEGVK
ncbi:MAG TPA: NAD(P)H-dependent oxidoreductase subunit E [Candidatus Hydrogenedens sp.]|nr:NAD(P)H-dependent oxidoreductase subunit E [Candidatus Hydrogenedens sp.]HOL20613.1 NAD(P)H-dependent oxidoreductase subunit E [Candidatus Hydrogenedens sp.]HPP59457.1 NAD(P)H-dependent oxidoreductase subunit E [Candidatus Hydrogenedens sp.]